MRFKPDWFLLGLAAAVALAWGFPGPGARGGSLHPEVLTQAGVALVFFLHGAGLAFAALKAGSSNWRLHAVVQAATFVLFPLLGLAIYFGLEGAVAPEARLGLLFLCAVPSTVSSSVALTAVARGNVAGALFNATLSSLIGVVLTPLWVAVAVSTSGTAPPLGPVILDLVQWLVLPLALGQAARPALAGWIDRHRGAVSAVDRVVILLLVYVSFCDSFVEGVWAGQGLQVLAIVLALSLALFGVVMLLVGWACGALGFSREDRIAALFGGSKKSLAAGMPMAKLLFAAHPGVGMIVLPLMVYHSMQLIVCAWLAARWATARPQVRAGETNR